LLGEERIGLFRDSMMTRGAAQGERLSRAGTVRPFSIHPQA